MAVLGMTVDDKKSWIEVTGVFLICDSVFPKAAFLQCLSGRIGIVPCRVARRRRRVYCLRHFLVLLHLEHSESFVCRTKQTILSPALPHVLDFLQNPAVLVCYYFFFPFSTKLLVYLRFVTFSRCIP